MEHHTCLYFGQHCAGRNEKYIGFPVPLTKIKMWYHRQFNENSYLSLEPYKISLLLSNIRKALNTREISSSFQVTFCTCFLFKSLKCHSFLGTFRLLKLFSRNPSWLLSSVVPFHSVGTMKKITTPQALPHEYIWNI